MKMEYIEKIFKNRNGGPIGDFHKSAVMILLIEEDGEIYILFEKRALHLRKQPGDISLPGGGIEEGESPMEAAVRETEEELNINKKEIEVIGEMDYFISPYNSIIFPFVGKLKRGSIHPNKDEVDHIFKVPLKFFLENNPIAHEVEIRPHMKEDFPYHLIHGGKNYKFSRRRYNQYFYIFKDYVIWGFTAQIIKRFVEIIEMN
jgi:8-oxo-dGTP pyrophosphatase MutT (NUDIX family)